MNKIIKKIIEKTQYKGNNDPNVKQISASQFGDELLQIWLRYKYGVIPNEKFTQSTLGSLVHIGIQEIVKHEPEIEVEKDVLVKFSNGWTLSGSIDIVDNKEKVIYDIKVTTNYTLENILKNKDHNYIWQLSVYRYLMKELTGIDYNTKLLMILKDGNEFDNRKQASTPHFEIVNIEPKTYSDIESKFNEIVDKLELHEEIGSYPEQCKDLWIRKLKNGKIIKKKCEIYCSYKDVCPYYKKNENINNIRF
ncbi:MAG: hypothetical protein GXO49_06375 [Chlorobi bacterium]|nr:hypothetical protein [Chlorobiota bacterium]